MALGTGLVTPAQITIQSQYSEGSAAFLAKQFKIVPQNPDGTPYDCTSATSATIHVTNTANGLSIAQVATTATPTLGTHDATGVTLTLTAANQAALGVIGTQNAVVSITITDGTTTPTVAVGNYLLSIVG